MRTETPITENIFALRPALVGMRADVQNLAGLVLSYTGCDGFVEQLDSIMAIRRADIMTIPAG